MSTHDNADQKNSSGLVRSLIRVLIAIVATVALLIFLTANRALAPKGERLAYRPMESLDIPDDISMPAQPPPPPEQQQPLTPPPQPPPEAVKLPKLELTTNIEAPALMVADDRTPLDIEMKKIEFSEIKKPPPPPTPKSKPTYTSSKSVSKPSPTKKAPNIYSAQHLDSQPRLINRPKVSFPRSLKIKGHRQGKVTLEIVISTSGRVTIRRIISSTHPEFIPMARSFASRARFTPPKKNGKIVNAVFNWPLVLRP